MGGGRDPADAGCAAADDRTFNCLPCIIPFPFKAGLKMLSVSSKTPLLSSGGRTLLSSLGPLVLTCGSSQDLGPIVTSRITPTGGLTVDLSSDETSVVIASTPFYFKNRPCALVVEPNNLMIGVFRLSEELAPMASLGVASSLVTASAVSPDSLSL